MRIPVLHDLTDEELVSRAKNGSDAASTLLVGRYTTAVYRLALGITKSHHDAEDIVQETFIKIFRHIRVFSPEKASFKTWILTIARNQSINAFSALTRRAARFFSEEASEYSNPGRPGESMLLEPLDPESLLVTKQELKKLDDALKRLPEKQRTAVLLKTHEDLSSEEIATVLKCSISSVESLIYRARRNLMRFMKD